MFTLETSIYKNNGSIVTEVTNLSTDETLWIMKRSNIYSKDKVTVYSEKEFNRWLNNLEPEVYPVAEEANKTVAKLNLTVLFDRFRNGNLDTYRDLSNVTVRFYGSEEVKVTERSYYLDIYQNNGEDMFYRIAKKFEDYNEMDKVVFVHFDREAGEALVSRNKTRLMQAIGKGSEFEHVMDGSIYLRNNNKDFDRFVIISLGEIGTESPENLEYGQYLVKNV